MAKRTVFKNPSATCTVAFVECWRVSISGYTFKTQEAVRAILGSTGWRIDKTVAVAGAWMPWEAISGESFSTLERAKKELHRFIKEGQKLEPGRAEAVS